MDYAELTEEIRLLELEKLALDRKLTRLKKERELLTTINTDQIRLDGC